MPAISGDRVQQIQVQGAMERLAKKKVAAPGTNSWVNGDQWYGHSRPPGHEGHFDSVSLSQRRLFRRTADIIRYHHTEHPILPTSAAVLVVAQVRYPSVARWHWKWSPI